MNGKTIFTSLVLVIGLLFGETYVAAGMAKETATQTNGTQDTPQPEQDKQEFDVSYRTSPLDVLGVRGIAHVEEGVPVRMRDGTVLNATLIIPNDAGTKSRRPAVLVQTPYLPQMELSFGVEAALVRQGYVVAVVNVRGTQWSEGEYQWLKGAAKDGYDTVEWVAHQPWSNGRVGTFGCSSSGEVQYATAKMNPPGLKAFVAGAAATGYGVIPGYADQGIFYTGGVPGLDWAWWYHGNGYLHHPKLPSGLSQKERAALIHAFDPVAYEGMSEDLSWADHLPSAEILNAIGSPETGWNRMITMAPGDPGWKEYDFLNTGDSTKVPGLHIDSWYDAIEIYGTSRGYEYLNSNSPNQYMIIGPGPHCKQFGPEANSTTVGERPVGKVQFDYTAAVVAFFNHWVRDDGKGKLDMPKVQYYPLESNKWVKAESWPPKSTPRKLYLTSRGHANSQMDDGQLVDKLPDANTPSDHYLNDPMNPVPSNGGGCCDANVAKDQTEIEKRDDVLVYTTPPLKEPLDIAGYIHAVLYFSTSVPDTDIAFKLVDVYPDGKAYNILDTMQRLRYRKGINRVKMMEPDKVYKIRIGGMVTASHFEPGHRLRIEIAGTNFPQYERNLNTGGKNYNETKAVKAKTVIHHDADHASYLEIPVVP